MHFFGHKDIREPKDSCCKKTLKELLRKLILEEQAEIFYVGNEGDFDRAVQQTLQELCREFSHIQFWVVLAYMPIKTRANRKVPLGLKENTLFPEELAKAHPKFAISHRNRWMLKQSDIVITYVNHISPAARNWQSAAVRMGKRVYNIAPNSFF